MFNYSRFGTESKKFLEKGLDGWPAMCLLGTSKRQVTSTRVGQCYSSDHMRQTDQRVRLGD